MVADQPPQHITASVRLARSRAASTAFAGINNPSLSNTLPGSTSTCAWPTSTAWWPGAISKSSSPPAFLPQCHITAAQAHPLLFLSTVGLVYLPGMSNRPSHELTPWSLLFCNLTHHTLFITTATDIETRTAAMPSRAASARAATSTPSTSSASAWTPTASSGRTPRWISVSGFFFRFFSTARLACHDADRWLHATDQGIRYDMDHHVVACYNNLGTIN